MECTTCTTCTTGLWKDVLLGSGGDGAGGNEVAGVCASPVSRPKRHLRPQLSALMITTTTLQCACPHASAVRSRRWQGKRADRRTQLVRTVCKKQRVHTCSCAQKQRPQTHIWSRWCTVIVEEVLSNESAHVAHPLCATAPTRKRRVALCGQLAPTTAAALGMDSSQLRSSNLSTSGTGTP